jgi:glycosyltransferase involved in cell wall biosynthesis
MKNVVMIAYDFPPCGSAGAYRPLRFVQQLPALRWSASVVSFGGSNFERYDPGLLELVPKQTEVVRVRQGDPWQSLQVRREQHLDEKLNSVSNQQAIRIRAAHQEPLRSRLRQIVRKIEACCYHPDMAMSWIRPAVKATLKLCARKHPDVMFATGGPWSSFIVAQRVSKRTDIPYVLDFRDSWTMAYNDFDALRPAWATRSDRRTLYKLLKGARAVIFRYQSEAECYWRAYQTALKASKIHIIPNGYSGEIDEFVIPRAERFTILYAGTLPPYRYDTFLQGVQQLKKSDPARASQLRFLFVGDGMESLSEEADAAGLSDIIETSSTIPYAEVVRLQQNAHALLLLGVKPMKGFELCGSKVFGYLKANRPILGIVSPADEMRKVLSRVGVFTVADPDAPCEIVAALRQLTDAWSAGTLVSLLPNRVACAPYSAGRQTAALVRAFQGAHAAEPFVPGSVEIPPSLQEEIGDGNWVGENDIKFWHRNRLIGRIGST